MFHEIYEVPAEINFYFTELNIQGLTSLSIKWVLEETSISTSVGLKYISTGNS